METVMTDFGKVTVSKPYFSNSACSQVRNLTLVKPENEAYGWGICRELPENLTITPEIVNLFAKEASQFI
ncbi:hypothetical protein [Vibrio cholerae]|uniref:hypothetical protein n=1 Tax=Vibrio cholerae TaxID=666 RepID=UPI0021B418DB|nr:hypothetical protein [Vibrio cholerae]MED7817258.1 hypothetical protein [Vibrio cholerae]